MATDAEDSSKLQKPLILLVIGFFVILAGIIILIVATALQRSGSVNFGAIIFIGPFPIVVGAGPEATWMILIAIIIAVLSIIMFLVMRKETKKADV